MRLLSAAPLLLILQLLSKSDASINQHHWSVLGRLHGGENATTATATTEKTELPKSASSTTETTRSNDDGGEGLSNTAARKQKRPIKRLLKTFKTTVSTSLQNSNMNDDEIKQMIGERQNSMTADDVQNLDDVTPQSDLRRFRHYHVVTTAALPWFTGTAVNPLLRAAYLYRRNKEHLAQLDEDDEQKNTKNHVTLVVPWLELPDDQEQLYGRIFKNGEEQAEYIRTWLREDADMPDAAQGLNIEFYPARYHSGLGSIFAMGDMIVQAIDESNNGSDSNAAADVVTDVCILEEPEHCNWYRAPGDGWTQRFNYVVGIVHTNYKEYASAHYSGLFTAPAIAMFSSAMVRAYCHKVIKLSDTLQSYAVEKETTSNVHGVRSNFWQHGQKPNAITRDSTKIYFIGKLLWAKGLDLLLDLQDYYKSYTGEYFPMDIYGNGPDQKAIQRAFHGRRNAMKQEQEEEMEESSDDEDETASTAAKRTLSMITSELPKTFSELRKQPIPVNFPGRVDHGECTTEQKIFVNPSISEVLCTTTAEALAMGKFAIIPVHPSNTFFYQFPNCLAYRNKFEFVANLRWAMTHDPEPLTHELSQRFTWEAATDRLIESSAITWREAAERERKGFPRRDEMIAKLHTEMGKGVSGDILRKVLGGGPASYQVKYQKDNKSGDDDVNSGDEKLSFTESIQAALAGAAAKFATVQP